MTSRSVPVVVRSRGRQRVALAWINLPALAAVVIWSAVFPFGKYALAEFPLYSYVAFRPLLAAVLIFGYLRLRGESPSIERQDWPRLAIAALGGMTVFQVFFNVGLSYTSASHSVLLITASPLLGAVILWALGRYRPDRRSLFGLLFGFAGVVLLLGGTGGGSGASLSGDLLTLVGALGWVVVTVVPRPLIGKYGPVRITAWMILAAGIASLPLAVTDADDLLRQTPSALAWLSLVYAAVLGMFLANTLWQRAVHALGSTQTMVYMYLQPMLAILLAAVLLGERMGLIQVLGGVVALVGVGLVRR